MWKCLFRRTDSCQRTDSSLLWWRKVCNYKQIEEKETKTDKKDRNWPQKKCSNQTTRSSSHWGCSQRKKSSSDEKINVCDWKANFWGSEDAQKDAESEADSEGKWKRKINFKGAAG